MSFLNPHFQSKKQKKKKVKIHQTCHQFIVSIMKATGCEGRENISTSVKLIMEDPGGETRRGGVGDNVIESRFMSCEIERIPPPTDIYYTSDSC